MDRKSGGSMKDTKRDSRMKQSVKKGGDDNDSLDSLHNIVRELLAERKEFNRQQKKLEKQNDAHLERLKKLHDKIASSKGKSDVDRSGSGGMMRNQDSMFGQTHGTPFYSEVVVIEFDE